MASEIKNPRQSIRSVSHRGAGHRGDHILGTRACCRVDAREHQRLYGVMQAIQQRRISDGDSAPSPPY